MTPFTRPPPDPVLDAGTVHAWRARLTLPAPELRALAASLSDDELRRAARFRFAVHRDRFIAARGQLRLLLARYLGLAPSAVAFERGPFGKPRLAGGGPRFSASHSEELALYAVAADREVGIDVERVRPMAALAAVADQFFAPGEARALRALAGEARARAFFACWTRKEALLKAAGVGLTAALEAVEVGFGPDPAVLRRAFSAGEEPACSTVVTLRPAPGYAGALAANGLELEVRCWTFAEEGSAAETDEQSEREIEA
ncbi:4'-phosphopantetheinyl transferase family protein [Anaeromyxobacter diazotrophicus]|uniref:4'-phosphopantetheinyl transferase n=1 Tax=Anaeromyxobacter diazotrophicus TaxID=2590199 RepID=A0A7I9VMZ0_9BACT|nr:4'-phosphopantetheinyl transferase superfamily protein [Anaeromyxobacter diazotrophicus]GEJ57776.1 4'-phosphopantetheinyl transferase [Anaeromyxobacter diazotrophicus]